MKYAVVFDPADDGSWGAVVPDLPGCTSAGDTLDEARLNVREAIELWIEVERERGHDVPPPITVAEPVEVGSL
ncbi:MAG TPA: type II toxin-antitoxin system HicB family antitoxin [Candidatus Baltobacteraceae bacterium]|jgi:predicted RNase H-like HicB family nuclease